MHEPDFWTDCAEAMEKSIEGERLIAREIAAAAWNVWRRMASLPSTVNLGFARRQPPFS